MALLHSLITLQPKLTQRIVVGHVNHKLRGKSSDADARFVQRLAKKLGVRCVVRVGRVLKDSGNLEEMARVSRYVQLQKLAREQQCRAILTAHTQDDQAETVLINLFRGCGVGAVSGMPESRSWGKGSRLILRPFLSVKKSEIKTYLKANRIGFRVDRSNSNLDFRRNWIRRRIFGEGVKKFSGLMENIAKFSAIVQDENEIWAALLDRAEKHTVRTWKGRAVLDIKRLLSYPAALQRRLLRRRPGGDLLTFKGIEQLRDWLRKPPTSGRVWQLRNGWVAERLSRSQGTPSAHWLLFRRASPIRVNA